MSATDQLKLEVGKIYEDNHGTKWRCLATDGAEPAPVILLNESLRQGITFSLLNGCISIGRSIVREVKPPQYRYINVYKSANGSLCDGGPAYFSRRIADIQVPPNRKRVACIKIELVEGRFDD